MNFFSGYTEEWKSYRAGEQTPGYPARTAGKSGGCSSMAKAAQDKGGNVRGEGQN